MNSYRNDPVSLPCGASSIPASFVAAAGNNGKTTRGQKSTEKFTPRVMNIGNHNWRCDTKGTTIVLTTHRQLQLAWSDAKLLDRLLRTQTIRQSGQARLGSSRKQVGLCAVAQLPADPAGSFSRCGSELESLSRPDETERHFNGHASSGWSGGPNDSGKS